MLAQSQIVSLKSPNIITYEIKLFPRKWTANLVLDKKVVILFPFEIKHVLVFLKQCIVSVLLTVFRLQCYSQFLLPIIYYYTS